MVLTARENVKVFSNEHFDVYDNYTHTFQQNTLTSLNAATTGIASLVGKAFAQANLVK